MSTPSPPPPDAPPDAPPVAPPSGTRHAPSAVFFFSFVTLRGVIAFFMSWIFKRSFLPFVVYRVALGATLLVLLSMGVIQPY